MYTKDDSELKIGYSSEQKMLWQNRYDLVMSAMGIGVWDWDIESGEIYWSQKFKDMLGITDPEFRPRLEDFADRLHPEDKDFTLKMLFDHVAHLCPYNVEYRLKCNDNKYIWINAYGQAEWDASGKAVRMAGSVNDISKNKIQQQELKSSSEQMKLLIENTPAAVAMLDCNLNYIMTSNRWIEDYKIDCPIIIGKNHYDLFPEILEMPRWLDIHKRALKGEVFPIQEDSWLRADGESEWIKWAIHPWINSEGQVGGIIIFTEVVTLQKKAEQALITSEETFRSAMEYASIGMALVSLDGRWIKVNRALCEILGFSEAELLSIDFQSITHPDDLNSDLALVKKVLSGELETYEIEKRYLNKNGKIIWSVLNVSLVRHTNGTPNYFISQIRDITESRQIERIKNEFISNISHELRTPLTSITGALGLIAGGMSKDLPGNVIDLINIANKNSERLVVLVNDILDIDKITSGKMRFNLKVERVSELIDQAVAINKSYADKFKVSIRIAKEAEDCKIKVDSIRFVQVISNLISNSAKFSSPGGQILIRILKYGDKVRVAVEDQGLGIPESFRKHIFNKFSQADSSIARNKGGTGLGLYISRQLVESMEGIIGFESEVGKGATFWIEFKSAGSDLPLDDSIKKQTVSDNGQIVLICEDSPDTAIILKMILKKQGIICDIAPSLADARKMLKEKKYSVLPPILD